MSLPIGRGQRLPPAIFFRDRPLRPEAGVERRLRVVWEVRLPIVHVGEEAAVAVGLQPTGHEMSKRIRFAAEVLEHLGELEKAAIEGVALAGHDVRHESGVVDVVPREQLGQGELVAWQRRAEGGVLMPLGILRGPYRRHRGQGVDGRGEGVAKRRR